MKIALISDHASPLATIGGVDSGEQTVYVAYIACELGPAGHIVDVFTRRDVSTLPPAVPFARNVRAIDVPAVERHATDERLSFQIRPQDAAFAMQKLRAAGIDLERPWIVLHPGATPLSRRYPCEHFASVADRLDESAQRVITGDASEVELAETLRRSMPATAASLAGKLTIGELVAVIAPAKLLIVNKHRHSAHRRRPRHAGARPGLRSPGRARCARARRRLFGAPRRQCCAGNSLNKSAQPEYPIDRPGRTRLRRGRPPRCTARPQAAGEAGRCGATCNNPSRRHRARFSGGPRTLDGSTAMYTLGINAAYHDSAACLVDDGVVVAAAEEERFNRIKHGPAHSDAVIEGALRWAKVPYRRLDDAAEGAAQLLAGNRIIGWFQDRMEFGPRALGARSILASPIDPDMQTRLNEPKGREDFRPVAAAVLEEAIGEWFINGEANGGKAPFMLFVDNVAPDKARRIPSAVHVDNTARVQTVSPESNPRYHALLRAFARRTGVPILVNTSVNVRGEPIVCTARHAIEAFYSTLLDALVIGSFLVEKRS